MKYLAANLVLAIVWMLMTGRFTLGSFVIGGVVGFAVIAMLREVVGGRTYVRAVFGILRLSAGFARALVLANLQLARDVLRPVPPFRPGIVTFDASELPPVETVLLSNLISLTPGTLTIEVADDGSLLHVHAVYAEDRARIRSDIGWMADLILGAMGRTGGR